MARDACRRESFKLSNRRALVAGIALHGGVRAQEWKAVLVILDLLDGNLPAQHGMALRAIRAEFPPVNVRVAIGAIFADISEDGLDVTFVAFHFFVHAAKGIFGAVVVEFRNSANGPPRCGRVAIFARDGQRPMRALRAALLRQKLRGEQNQPQNEQEPDTDLWSAWRKLPRRPRLTCVVGGVS